MLRSSHSLHFTCSSKRHQYDKSISYHILHKISGLFSIHMNKYLHQPKCSTLILGIVHVPTNYRKSHLDRSYLYFFKLIPIINTAICNMFRLSSPRNMVKGKLIEDSISTIFKYRLHRCVIKNMKWHKYGTTKTPYKFGIIQGWHTRAFPLIFNRVIKVQIVIK